MVGMYSPAPASVTVCRDFVFWDLGAKTGDER